MPDVAALQLLVPAAAPLLDAVRGRPGVGLLEPPHVSLGYPWRDAATGRASADAVRAAASQVPPWATTLTGPHRFAADGRGRVLLHARLADDAPVRRLAQLLGADLRDVHLSLARVLPDGDVDAVEAALSPLLPLGVRLAELELTAQRDGRWEVVARVPLGASEVSARPSGAP